MAGDTVITVIGNLTANPELRFTPNGVAVADFTVASTPRRFDRNANEWKDSDPLFMRCNIWRAAAENVAECLIMWISKMKIAVYRQFYDVDMSISSTSGAIAIPAH